MRGVDDSVYDSVYDYAGYASYLARRLVGPAHRDFDDLRQQACLGLLEARTCGLYDPAKGAFKPYATQWARGYMLNYLSRKKLVRSKEARILPIPEESLDAEGDDRLQVAADAIPADEAAAAAENLARATGAAETLRPRQQAMLGLRYGGEGYTLQQVAEHFGLSRERTRQLLAQSLAFIRQQLEYADAAAQQASPPGYRVDFDTGSTAKYHDLKAAVDVATRYREGGGHCLIHEYIGSNYWDHLDALSPNEVL